MSSNIEAILLTGGASRRMGSDKAKMLVEGEELAVRIARLLSERGISVTVCGRDPIGGYAFQPDAEEFAGPLAALAGFTPTRQYVFVVSCDLPGFNPAVVELLAQQIGDHDAAIPTVAGQLQPLCGVYKASAFPIAKELATTGERRVMRWIDRLDHVDVDGIDPNWIKNANSPQDL